MKEDKQIVQDGKFVGYTYRLYDASDHTMLFEAPASAPDVMVYGVSQDVIPGLTAALKGLSAGDKFSVKLPPEAAFGEYYPDNMIELDKGIFERDGELAKEVVIGAELPMMTQQGFMVRGRVLDITSDKVKMDFNHPFAGKTVEFDGEVVEVRDATDEEKNPPTHSCGCGHCGGGDGSCGCGDGSCGCSDGSCSCD